MKSKVSSFSLLAVVVFLGLVLGLFPARVQASTIAILQSADIKSYDQTVKAFLDYLPHSLNKTNKFSLHGDLKNGSQVIADISAIDADVVVAVGLKAALVVRQGLSSVPSIFCMVLNPEKYNLTQSHMTGIALEIPFEDQIESLQKVLPKIKRVGVIYNPLKTGRIVKGAIRQAKNLGVELVPREISSEKEVPATLRAIVPHIDALWLLPDSTVLTPDSFNFLLQTTLEANIPVVGFSPDLVSKGVLLSVHFSYEDVGKQAARLAKKFLNGHKLTPGVVLTPEPLRLAINLKTANFLGISVPPNVLNRFQEMY